MGCEGVRHRGFFRTLVAIAFLAAGAIALRSQLVPNLFLTLTEPAFYVPAESSYRGFTVLENNPGSGDWWRYARDERHHFAQLDARRAHLPRDRQPPDSPIGFHPLDRETWGAAAMERTLDR
jgi:hypothetical protein